MASFAVRLGEDGNVYLMRRTSPATVYVISSSGDLLRTLSIEPADNGQMPYDMRVAEGRIAVEFSLSCSADHCEGANFTVADATTGQKLFDYTDDKSLAGGFACYSAKPERFTCLRVGDGDKPIFKYGEQIRFQSADGTKVARWTSAGKPDPYINLTNTETGGN